MARPLAYAIIGRCGGRILRAYISTNWRGGCGYVGAHGIEVIDMRIALNG